MLITKEEKEQHSKVLCEDCNVEWLVDDGEVGEKFEGHDYMGALRG